MTDTGSIHPPPGWYPDPWGQQPWRWWDGSRWTGHVSDPSVPRTGPGSAVGTGPAYPSGAPVGATGWPVPSAAEALAAESAAAPWAGRAFAWYVVVVIVGLLVAWSESSSIRQVFHELRVQASSRASHPEFQTSIWRTDLLGLVNLAVITPFYVGVLVWQHRAATMALRLGLPAAHSAGLGAGSWFIPVVNFWFPYQALRDCLPAGHPDRRTVGRLWACFIAALVVTAVAEVLTWVGTPVAFGFAVAAAAFGAAFAGFGIRAVGSISRAHRQLLDPAAGGAPVRP